MDGGKDRRVDLMLWCGEGALVILCAWMLGGRWSVDVRTSVITYVEFPEGLRKISAMYIKLVSWCISNCVRAVELFLDTKLSLH